jgi:hypothetical protein
VNPYFMQMMGSRIGPMWDMLMRGAQGPASRAIPSAAPRIGQMPGGGVPAVGAGGAGLPPAMAGGGIPAAAGGGMSPQAMAAAQAMQGRLMGGAGAVGLGGMMQGGLLSPTGGVPAASPADTGASDLARLNALEAQAGPPPMPTGPNPVNDPNSMTPALPPPTLPTFAQGGYTPPLMTFGQGGVAGKNPAPTPGGGIPLPPRRPPDLAGAKEKSKGGLDAFVKALFKAGDGVKLDNLDRG